ncbi:MAG: hypothetical protein ACJAWI_000544 [Marinomonas primoryensis]|jgi:hypothetical protein
MVLESVIYSDVKKVSNMYKRACALIKCYKPMASPESITQKEEKIWN